MNKNFLYNPREIRDLKDMVIQSEKLFGNRNAFLVKTKNDSYKGITYSEFKNDVDALGTAFIDLGLKDEYIAVIGENRYEWCVTYLATVNGTGITVPLDKELPPADIQNLINTSKVSAIIFSGKHAEDIKNMSSALESVKHYINMDASETEGDFLSYNELIEKGKGLVAQGNKAFLDAEVDNEKMNMLIFTSGTTGFAKGVMLSHKNISSNIMSAYAMVGFDTKDTCLSILPLHHTFECTGGFLQMIYGGSTIAFCEGLKHIGKNLKEIKPTALILVPLLVENMYSKVWDSAAKKKGMTTKLKAALGVSNFLHKVCMIDVRRKVFKQVLDNFGGNLNTVICGAAAVNPDVSKGFDKMGIKILQGYGLTECSPMVSGNRRTANIYKSIGPPSPGVKVKIDNPNEEGIGEVIVQGDNVMLGYFQNEEATKACLKDGWFHSGDLGYEDKKGFFYITGRIKNVIVTKNGKNIFPEEVESYINKSPFVLESLVWGDYDEESGETMVKAQIVPNFDNIKEKLKVTLPTKDEIYKILNDAVKTANKNMPLYKQIKKFTVRDNEFVKTTTKKIKRYVENNAIRNKGLEV